MGSKIPLEEYSQDAESGSQPVPRPTRQFLISTPEYLRAPVAECCGTMILVLFGIASNAYVPNSTRVHTNGPQTSCARSTGREQLPGAAPRVGCRPASRRPSLWRHFWGTPQSCHHAGPRGLSGLPVVPGHSIHYGSAGGGDHCRCHLPGQLLRARERVRRGLWRPHVWVAHFVRFCFHHGSPTVDVQHR